MAEDVRYFVYTGPSTYSKIGGDGSIYQFKGGCPVAVKDFNDKMKFAGNSDFYETDKNGAPVKESDLPTNNSKTKPLSYAKMGEERPTPVATPSVSKAAAEAKADVVGASKTKTSSSKPKSKK